MEPCAATMLSPKDKRQNWAAFLLDYVFFGMGLAFAGTTTMMPAFVSRFTENPIWIGLIGVVWSGGWLVPQIFAANFLSTHKRKMPAAILISWIGRPVFALFAVFLFLGGTSYAGLTLALFFLMILVFTVTDSIVGVAWFDILGKALPNRERGRLIGFGQIGSGVLSIVAGVIVRVVLEAPDIAFPNNYALLFLLADVAFLLSLAGFYFIREPVEPVLAERPRWRTFLPGMVRMLFADRAFLQVNAARLLVGFSGLAAPFFIVYALRFAGLPESAIGIFVAAQTIGTACAGILFGWLADRKGPHRVIRLIGGVYIFAPVLALATGWMSLGEPAGILIFAIIFFLMGMGDGSIMLGYLNYVLMIAPPAQRPVYIGLTNTLMGIAVLYPLAGGWIADAAGYPVVFIVSAAGILAGWITGWNLPDAHEYRMDETPG